jgi:O-antigen ligase
MELAMSVPLGLLFSGAIERDKRPLYIFAVALMGVSLILTGSRGALVSVVAEVMFLVAFMGFRGERETKDKGGKSGRVRTALMRVGLTFVLVLILIGGAVFFGGESALSRMIGTVNMGDPTTGRTHFWSVTLDIIRHHPVIGSGLGSYGVAYTQYDSRNGAFRLEQAHNDYLQIISDAGIMGAGLAVFFIVVLFRMGLARRETDDLFRRGVATGALAGCFAVLVHSFFDFTLHTTANALLFLILAMLATINGQVEQASQPRRHHRRRRSRLTKQPDVPDVYSSALPPSGH